MINTADDLAAVARTVLRATGQLARQCDRAEHNEGLDRSVVVRSGDVLRTQSVATMLRWDIDPVAAYADRLASLESRHVLANAGIYEAHAALRNAKTWKDLQLNQARHDAVYQPDVAGLAKADQLKHYTLHLAKLAWLLADASEGTGELSVDGVVDSEAVRDRLTDVLVFGVKLASVCGELLLDAPVEQAA